MKRNFITIEQGTSYVLPKYRVIDYKDIKEVRNMSEEERFTQNYYDESYQKITFVRGDKTANGKVIPRVDGILHEQLLAMMISDLRYKNGLVPNRHTSIAITHLEEALFRLEERVREREANGTLGTYQK